MTRTQSSNQRIRSAYQIGMPFKSNDNEYTEELTNLFKKAVLIICGYIACLIAVLTFYVA